jgi:folate-binding protein YgfZ
MRPVAVAWLNEGVRLYDGSTIRLFGTQGRTDAWKMIMTIHSPFAEKERVAGAVFTERFGVELPEHFGDPGKEYEAARTGVGLVDMSFRGLIELTGSDRLRWLNGQVTNDVKDLKPGEGTLAAVLNVKGHILADLAMYGLSGAVWIDLNRDRAQIVRDTFDRYIVADDVVAENASDRYAHLMVVGRDAQRFLVEAVGEGGKDLPAWRHVEERLCDVPARVIATRWLGMAGYDLIVPIEAAGRFWEALVSFGSDHGLHPVGMSALNRLRVEAGWPWYGVDFDDSNLLMESLTPDHVSFTKGCYIGQEVVIRVEHQGHLNKKLTGLLVSGEIVPSATSQILSGERKVGTVTSATYSPALKRVIALGYVRRECWDPGTTLRIVSGEQSLDAEVASLPFLAGV